MFLASRQCSNTTDTATNSDPKTDNGVGAITMAVLFTLFFIAVGIYIIYQFCEYYKLQRQVSAMFAPFNRMSSRGGGLGGAEPLAPPVYDSQPQVSPLSMEDEHRHEPPPVYTPLPTPEVTRAVSQRASSSGANTDTHLVLTTVHTSRPRTPTPSPVPAAGLVRPLLDTQSDTLPSTDHGDTERSQSVAETIEDSSEIKSATDDVDDNSTSIQPRQ